MLNTPVALFVVDLMSPSQSSMLCAWSYYYRELLCLFLSCLHLNLSSFVLLNTSSRSARCRLVSIISTFLALCWTPRLALLVVQLSLVAISTVNTLTFVGPVLVSFHPLCQSNFLRCSIFWPFSHRFEFGFCLAAFLKRLPST